MDDETSELTARIKDRDPQALAQYIEQQRGQLTAFLRTITGEHLLKLVELDDLVQEVCTSALTGLPTAPLDEYEPMQWLQQLARRRVVDAHRFHFDAKRRDAGRQRSLSSGSAADATSPGLEQWLVASMTSPTAAVSQDIRLSRMQDAIESLPEEQRLAIRLRYAEGLPTKRIAERLGKTDVAVRVLLSRSMRQLESLLADVKPTR